MPLQHLVGIIDSHTGRTERRTSSSGRIKTSIAWTRAIFSPAFILSLSVGDDMAAYKRRMQGRSNFDWILKGYTATYDDER